MEKQINKPHVWSYFTTQKQWKLYLQDLLEYSDRAVKMAILCIDDLQTETEKAAKQTIDENEVGWTKYDAEEMGLIAFKVRNGIDLTNGEFAKSRNKMKKYWKQLMYISKQRMVQKTQNSTTVNCSENTNSLPSKCTTNGPQ